MASFGGYRRRDPISRALLISGIIIIPGLAIGATTWGVSRVADIERMDRETFCYRQDEQAHTGFMIDASFDSITSERQKRDLRNALIGAFENMEPNGQLSVFTTAKDKIGTFLVPVIRFCRPMRTLDEQTQVGVAKQTQAYLSRHYEEARRLFIGQVDELIAKAADPERQADHSPIMEQVQSLSHHGFSGRLRKMVIYTDGLQNSEVRRFCLVKGHLPSFERFSQHSDYRLVRPGSLAGVDIEILLVEHTLFPSKDLKFCTNNEIRAFWTGYFEAADAASVQMIRLPYGGLGRS